MPNAPESDRPENVPVPPAAASSPQNPGDPAQTAATTPAAGTAPTNPDDEFLDYEPLTPELLEEEAIRGDFVLRWAVVLLALFLASSKIVEPRTMFHMKSGEYIAQNGVPKFDPFSASAAGRPWTNLSWGFDLLTHAIHSPMALSLVKALLVALTFGLLVHISRPGVSSWWGSICATAAVVACLPHFTVEPHVITILGTALLLFLLHNSSIRDSSSRMIWGLVPLFLVWSNLDNRAFLGLFFLLLYGIGSQIQAMFRRDTSVTTLGVPASKLWMVIAACFVVVNVHPFFDQVLRYPLSLYGHEYPSYRSYLLQQPNLTTFGIQFFPLIKAQFWNDPHVPGVVGIVLMAAAGAALILNWSQMELKWLLVYLGAVLLSFMISPCDVQ